MQSSLSRVVAVHAVMIALAAGTAAIGRPARAAEAQRWAVAVPVGGLDLSTTSGQSTLRHRLIGAVRSQYAVDPSGDMLSSLENDDLERQAIRRATAIADRIIANARQTTHLAAAQSAAPAGSATD